MLLHRLFAGVSAALLVRYFHQAVRDSSTVTKHLDPTVTLEHGYDVSFWTRRFGVTKQQLKSAIDKVGNRASLIEQYLESRARYAAAGALPWLSTSSNTAQRY